MFNEKYLEHKVGRTKFFELRPLWAFPVQKQSQEVCKWIYHKNIDMICETLVNNFRDFKLSLKMSLTLITFG